MTRTDEVFGKPSFTRARWIFRRLDSVLICSLVALCLTACTGQPYGLYEYDDFLRLLEPALAVIRLVFALAGLALLVAGWKIYRFVVAVPGLLIGAILGAALGYGTNENWLLAIIGLALGGVVGAWLALILHDLVIFVIGAIVGAIIVGGAYAALSESMPPTLVLIIAGLIGGVGFLALARLWVVVLSSAIGAVMFGLGINAGVGWMFLFCIAGIAVQYGLASALGEQIPTRLKDLRQRQLLPSPAGAAQPGAGGVSELPVSAVREAPVSLPPPLTAALIDSYGVSFDVRDGSLIGRGSICDLRLPDRAVSRQHALIRYAQGRWFIQDQGSTHGTFVNGQRMDAIGLNAGDRITIGNYEFEFRLH